MAHYVWKNMASDLNILQTTILDTVHEGQKKKNQNVIARLLLISSHPKICG